MVQTHSNMQTTMNGDSSSTVPSSVLSSEADMMGGDVIAVMNRINVQTCSYLAPISLYAAMLKADKTLVEVYDHYQKQTIRNRCVIDSPNGLQTLVIPVEKPVGGGHCLMKDVRISDHANWRHQHWNAFMSNYYNSAFFEYYQDDFRPFYERKWTFLADFNEALMDKCMELIDMQPCVERTTEYMGQHEEVSCKLPQYYQVFAHKHGFTPDLSIVDLLFNMGPESLLVLQKATIL